MSETDPEVLRAEIARMRAELSDNVDALTETANPKNVADRRVNKVESAARGVKEHLMGAPDDSDDGGALGDRADALKARGTNAVGSVQDRTPGALQTVSDTPGQVRRRARGNPLAAGLIAFGIGYLISSAIPSSEKEEQAASRLQDKAAPLTDEVREAVSDVADRLRERPGRQQSPSRTPLQKPSPTSRTKVPPPRTRSSTRFWTRPPPSKTAHGRRDLLLVSDPHRCTHEPVAAAWVMVPA